MSKNVTTVSNGENYRVIKKYANRKLYDTGESKYVTLSVIQDIVKSGQAVIVIDNVSKRDITAKTLLMSLVTCRLILRSMSFNSLSAACTPYTSMFAVVAMASLPFFVCLCQHFSHRLQVL